MNRSALTSIFKGHGQAGLTLMEVLIAVVLLAFIMFTVVAVQDNAFTAKDRTVAFNADTLQIETAMHRLEADLLQTYSPLFMSKKFAGSMDPTVNPGLNEIAYHFENNPRFKFPSEEGIPVPVVRSNEKEELILFTAANRRKLENSKQSYYMWVAYKLADSPAEYLEAGKERLPEGNFTGKDLVRYTFPDDPFKKEEWNLVDTHHSILLPNVEALEFSFWNPTNKKFETGNTVLENNDYLIRGLQVSITWYDNQGNKRQTVRVFRSHWPGWIPTDGQNTSTTTTTGSTNGGAPGGGNTQGTQGGGDNGNEVE